MHNDLLSRAVVAEERTCQLMNEIEAVRRQSVWQTQDPRESIVRSRIVVIAGDRVVFGDVETKHGYFVSLDHSDRDWRRLVAEDEEWPGWYWAPMPQNQ